MKDLIYRQDAIDALEEVDWYHQNKNKDMVLGANPPEHQAWYKEDDIFKTLEALPSAQPDLSFYSDKLWRNAYERGKAEAQAEIIRCRDCKYYREYGYVNGKPKFLPKCTFSSIYVNADDFCSRAERRTDE